MPKRPKDQKHEVIAAAADHADFPADDGKTKAAQWLGQRGGKARAKGASDHEAHLAPVSVEPGRKKQGRSTTLS